MGINATSSRTGAPAVVLLSGGLDSATTLAVARAGGFACHCLTVDYGQRHRHELQASRRVATALGALEHRVVSIDLRAFGGSALTADIEVPRGRSDAARSEGIPVTYVPARNLVFLSMASAYAEVIGSCDVFIGVNAVDFSGYPDCRPEFIASFEEAANRATKAGAEGRRLKVHSPLINLTKAQIIRAGLEAGVDYSMTHSCYDPDSEGRACGECDSCLIRKQGFADAGVADPTAYAAGAKNR